MSPLVTAAIVDVAHHTTVFKSGWVEITLGNLVALLAVLVLFAVGLAVQLPGRRGRDGG